MSSMARTRSALAAGSGVVRGFAAAGAASRWLAVSIVRHDVEPGSPSQTVSQPLRPRFRRKPDHALHRVPCKRLTPDNSFEVWSNVKLNISQSDLNSALSRGGGLSKPGVADRKNLFSDEILQDPYPTYARLARGRSDALCGSCRQMVGVVDFQPRGVLFDRERPAAFREAREADAVAPADQPPGRIQRTRAHAGPVADLHGPAGAHPPAQTSQ